MQTVKQAVLQTLAYFDLFGVPLTRGEVSEHLLWGDFDDDKIDIYLKESPLVHYHAGYFSLHREPEFWEAWRDKLALQKKYFKKVRRYQGLLNLCPFIKLIAVCNTLPLGDVHPGSDIDLFVIAKKNRLFLARWWLTALTSLLGIRRHGSKIKKRFCLSFYITEERLNLESIALQPTDIYLAYWLKTLEPIAGDYATYETLMAQNRWIKTYFHTLFPKRRYFRKSSALASTIRKFLEWILDREKYELETRNKQLARIHDKARGLTDRSGTVISDTMLKFHDHDARSEIAVLWENRTAELL
jgi:hypothetical protein